MWFYAGRIRRDSWDEADNCLRQEILDITIRDFFRHNKSVDLTKAEIMLLSDDSYYYFAVKG